jgi:hypothetical protein
MFMHKKERKNVSYVYAYTVSMYAALPAAPPACAKKKNLKTNLLNHQVQIREAVLVRGPLPLVLLTLGHELVQ